MTEEMEKQMLDELRSQTELFKRANMMTVVATTVLCIAMAVYFVSLAYRERIAFSREANTPTVDSWQEVRNLVEKGDLEKGKAMLLKLVAKHPDYYYGYKWMGYLEQELGNLEQTEVNFAKACDLYPTEDNEKDLAAIRKVIEKKNKAVSPTLPKAVSSKSAPKPKSGHRK